MVHPSEVHLLGHHGGLDQQHRREHPLNHGIHVHLSLWQSSSIPVRGGLHPVRVPGGRGQGHCQEHQPARHHIGRRHLRNVQVLSGVGLMCAHAGHHTSAVLLLQDQGQHRQERALCWWGEGHGDQGLGQYCHDRVLGTRGELSARVRCAQDLQPQTRGGGRGRGRRGGQFGGNTNKLRGERQRRVRVMKEKQGEMSNKWRSGCKYRKKKNRCLWVII